MKKRKNSRQNFIKILSKWKIEKKKKKERRESFTKNPIVRDFSLDPCRLPIKLKSTHPADRTFVAVKGSISHFWIFYVAVRTGPSNGGSYQRQHVKVPRCPASFVGKKRNAKTSGDVWDSLDGHYGCDRIPFKTGKFG